MSPSASRARIAFATTVLDGTEHEDVDRPYHERSFAEAGIAVDHPIWHDPAVDWSAYDLVVIRSTWDYTTRLADFQAWLDRVAATTRVANPPAVIRWNLDKRYLLELAERGVPVIPTDVAETAPGVADALARHGDREVVVKPVVSAGSRHTGRFRADAAAARALAEVIFAEGVAVMVQPFARSVAEAGEVSLVLFDGEVSHAFRKGPLLAAGGGFVGGAYREDISPREADADQRAVAARCDAAVRAVCRERLGVDEALLYARYDLVRLDDGRTALLEAELFEPAFFLNVAPAGAARFRRAVLERAQSSPPSSPVR